MITRIALFAAVALIVVTAGCVTMVDGNLPGEAKRTETRAVPIDSISTLRVTTDLGAIKLNTAETAEVRITADVTVRARTDAEAQALLEGVRIAAEPSGDILVVKAEKPPGLGHNGMEVDFTITAPANLRLDFTTNVGSIELAYSPDAPAALDVRASVNVGSIDFTGPSEVSANLSVSVNVGDLRTDRPLTVRGSLGRSVQASLGSGEGQIDLRANVGSITIH